MLSAIILSLIMLLKLLDFEIINHTFVLLVIILSFIVSGYSLLIKYIYHTKKQKYYYYQTADFLFILNLALIFVQLFFIFVLYPATVEQESMDPTLKDGEDVLVISLGKISRGKVVIVKIDEKYNAITSGVVEDGEFLVKRVIAGPGDTFYYDSQGILFLNGVKVDEYYLKDQYGQIRPGARTEAFHLEDKAYIAGVKVCTPGKECKIPEDYYFVMGDNRRKSYDSRDFGLVHKSQIMGVAKYRRKGFFDWEEIR